MSLDSIVRAAKSSRTQTMARVIPSFQMSDRISGGKIIDKESIGSIAKRVVDESAAEKAEGEAFIPKKSWEECNYCKKEAERTFCRKFFSLCAKDNCPSKLRE